MKKFPTFFHLSAEEFRTDFENSVSSPASPVFHRQKQLKPPGFEPGMQVQSRLSTGLEVVCVQFSACKQANIHRFLIIIQLKQRRERQENQ